METWLRPMHSTAEHHSGKKRLRSGTSVLCSFHQISTLVWGMTHGATVNGCTAAGMWALEFLPKQVPELSESPYSEEFRFSPSDETRAVGNKVGPRNSDIQR